MISHVKAYFHRQQSAGAFPGGQLVVRRNGEPIASEAIGTARGFGGQESERPMPVGSQTLFPVYSCGKPLAAAAIAMLEDRGKLDPNAPVAEVFPEFARNGKAQITVLDVLTHRSGIILPHLHVPSRMDCWNDRERISKELENAVPRYPRGTLAYGPYEFGWILSEMVRRVDGRDLVDYFADEIASPLGLPELSFKLDGRNPNSIARSYWLGRGRVVVAGVNVADAFETTTNSALYLGSRNPACTLITNAASLAQFYDFMLRDGATPSGNQLISHGVLNKYTSRCVFGFDRTLRTFLSYGRGFTLGTLPPSIFGWWNTGQCFGHGGMFSSLAGADRNSGLSMAILTNGNRGVGDFTRRFIPLAHKIRKACQRAA